MKHINVLLKISSSFQNELPCDVRDDVVVFQCVICVRHKAPFCIVEALIRAV